MARLKTLKPRLRALPPRIRMPEGRAETERHRNAQPWRRWYKLARWRRLRWAVLIRDMFTCRMCGRIEADTSKLVADHREPHRGDEALFWDVNNLQTLCEDCHNGPKARMEARGEV